MRQPRWLIALSILIAGVLAAAFLTQPRGIKTVVKNSGATAMRDVRIAVTGRTYPLGDLKPGQTREVRVNPTGESGVMLDYADPDGAAHDLTLNCYFEASYSGRISVEVADGAVRKLTCNIRP